MVRKLRFSFLVVLAIAAFATACGRQVTPNPAGLGAGGAPQGYMAVFFSVAAPFVFSNYQYLVVFNTTGNGRTPSTDTVQTNWSGYSYAMVARGNGVATAAQAVQFRFSPSHPQAPPAWLPLGTTPQTFSYNLDANGTDTEFSILALKRIFSSPGPSPSPSPPSVWTFNAFVTQANGSGQWYFYDSLGAGGPTDPQYVSPQLCMTEPFDNTYYARGFTAPDQAQQITSIEIANNPVSPTSCP
jgi:hypothetical protein